MIFLTLCWLVRNWILLISWLLLILGRRVAVESHLASLAPWCCRRIFLYLSTRSRCTANVCLCKTLALEKVYIGKWEHFELLDDKSPYYTSMYWIGPHKVARGHVRNFFCLFVLQRFHFFYDVPTTVIYRVNVIFDEWWSTFCVLSEWGKLFLFVWQRFQT